MIYFKLAKYFHILIWFWWKLKLFQLPFLKTISLLLFNMQILENHYRYWTDNIEFEKQSLNFFSFFFFIRTLDPTFFKVLNPLKPSWSFKYHNSFIQKKWKTKNHNQKFIENLIKLSSRKCSFLIDLKLLCFALRLFRPVRVPFTTKSAQWVKNYFGSFRKKTRNIVLESKFYNATKIFLTSVSNFLSDDLKVRFYL